MQRTYTGLILAGGAGRRIQGQDKGLCIYQGRPLVEYSIDALKPHCRELFISCNRNQAQYSVFGLSLIGDETPGYPGPLVALSELLPQLPGTHVLVLPCDTPGVTSALVDRLIQASESHPEHWIYLRSNGRDHPLHAVIPTKLSAKLALLTRDGEERMLSALEKLHHYAVELEEAPQLNLNHPAMQAD